MAKMKKDESFLGKLGGTLGRKKKAKEGRWVGCRYGVTMELMMNDADHFSLFPCSSWCYNNSNNSNNSPYQRAGQPVKREMHVPLSVPILCLRKAVHVAVPS